MFNFGGRNYWPGALLVFSQTGWNGSEKMSIVLE